MVDVAQQASDVPVSRQSIAERQELSADYVAQLFRRLQSAGLVVGVKGPGGGYRLARDASQITAKDVVQVVEGPLAVVQCTLPCPDGDPLCERVNRCATHLLWRQLSEAIVEFLDSVTLQDLCDEAEHLLLEDRQLA
jgi:Rrf2 family iron-sulfur cluster assembly transcriptional regulator